MEVPIIDVATLWDCPFVCSTTRETGKEKPGMKNLGFQKKLYLAGEDFQYPLEDIKIQNNQDRKPRSTDWHVLDIEEMEEWFWKSYISTNMWIGDVNKITRFYKYNEKYGLTFGVEGNCIKFYLTKEIFWTLISDNIIFEAKTRNLMVGFMFFLANHPKMIYFNGESIWESRLKWVDLGRYFFRDHSTIISQYNSHNDMLLSDKFYKECFDKLKTYAELLMGEKWICPSKEEKIKGT